MSKLSANTRVATLAVTVCVVLIFLISLLSTERASDVVLSRPSTFFTDSTGSRALYLVLEQLLPPGTVGQWRRPLTLLDASRRSTLIVMGPVARLGPADADALDRWLEAGGQLILATSDPWEIASGEPESAGTNAREDFGSRHGIFHPEDLSGEAALAAAETREVGLGRIQYVADAHAFSNARLREDESAIWLAQRVSEWGGPVWFDEFHQGFGVSRSLFSLMGAFLVTPWGLACLQLGLAGLVYLVGYKKRFGAPVDPLKEERTSRIETAEALGGLFRAADARALAVKAIDQYVAASLSDDLGYRVDLGDPRLRTRLGDRDANELTSYLAGVGSVLGGRRPEDAELVRIGRQASTIGRSLRHGTSRKTRPLAAG